MAGEYNLSIIMTAQNEASGVINSFLESLGPVGAAVAVVGAALIGTGVTAVKMAGDFQESMTQLVTGAGESQANLGLVTQGILNMAVQTGTSTQQLSQGMYMIESAGFHGAAGLQVLQAAAEGAKVGNADLGSVANTVTSALNAYAMKSTQATAVTNSLIATVAAGKMHMQDLATSISNVLPAASAAHIGLTDIEGAIATMTMQGDDAASAATHLRQMIIALDSPSKAGATSLAAIGLTTQQVSDAMKKSLPGTLQMIVQHLDSVYKQGSPQWMTAVKNISGGSKQMMAMLELTGSHLDTFKNNVNTISGAVKSGGNSINGWSLVQQNFNFKMAQAGEILQTGMIRLGLVLLPIVTNLVSGFISFSGALGSFIGYLQGSSVGATAIKAVLAGLEIGILAFAATFIPVLVTSFIAWATAAGAAALATLAAAAPFIIIGVIAAAVIFGIIMAIQHWGQIVQFFSALWHTVWGAVSTFFVGVWNHIVAFFVMIWTNIVSFVKAHALLLLAVITGPIGAIVILIITHWNQIMSFLAGVWAWIVSTATGLWNDVINIFRNAWNGLNSALSNLLTNIRTWFTNLASNALQWGKDMIQNLINGITSMAGGVIGAVQNIAGKIAGFLHFTKPDVGPLASVESWMPDFGDLLSKGMLNQIPKLQAAVTAMVKPIATGATGSTIVPAVSGTGAPVVSAAGGASSGIQNNYITMNVGGNNIRDFAKMLLDEMQRQQRLSGLQPATASGRRY